MKKYLSLILALCLPALLGGCGAVPLPMPESPTPPPAADTEKITYEVSTDPYEQTVTAEDGTTLMVIDFQIPHLQAYANGTLIEDPSTPAQEQAMDRVHTFNENFDQWRESNSSEENVSFVKDLYRDMPEMFSEDHMAPLSEELTYTCYRTGTLISIAADYYSYLGGAHPNTVYFAWNYDLDSGMFLTISELAADPQTFTLAVADMLTVVTPGLPCAPVVRPVFTVGHKTRSTYRNFRASGFVLGCIYAPMILCKLIIAAVTVQRMVIFFSFAYFKGIPFAIVAVQPDMRSHRRGCYKEQRNRQETCNQPFFHVFLLLKFLKTL